MKYISHSHGRLKHSIVTTQSFLHVQQVAGSLACATISCRDLSVAAMPRRDRAYETTHKHGEDFQAIPQAHLGIATNGFADARLPYELAVDDFVRTSPLTSRRSCPPEPRGRSDGLCTLCMPNETMPCQCYGSVNIRPLCYWRLKQRARCDCH